MKNSTNTSVLDKDQITTYYEQGFLSIDHFFSNEIIEKLSRSLNTAISNHKNGTKILEGLVSEANSSSVRTINGAHLSYDIFNHLCSYHGILRVAQQLIQEELLYVHQFKINIKEAFTGDVWEWHQDYIFWLKGDGMPAPKALSIVILLDDVTEFNAPLMFVPGSHKQGTLSTARINQDNNSPEKDSWLKDVAASIKYPVDRDIVSKLVQENGLVAPKMQKGSLLVLDGNVLHASSANLSPFARRFMLITYNPITNVDPNLARNRPEFLSSSKFLPLVPNTKLTETA
mmetsp:Transcript_10538/g.24470  ORF Transcript_10538/g.24470 Transcript_10538/m.24470 type:complete len:287 (-) Transcript_10538:346-1206(-)